jgi:hypothetical protein
VRPLSGADGETTGGSGGRGAQDDTEGALRGYLRAAEMGLEVGQSNAAYLLERRKDSAVAGQQGGSNTSLSLSSALHYHQCAADQGNIGSLLRIGDAHYYGRGTPVDLNKSVAVYRQATQLRSAQAMFNLAVMHEHGWGLSKDLHLAKRFYDMAESASADAMVPVMLAKVKLTVHIWIGASICCLFDAPPVIFYMLPAPLALNAYWPLKPQPLAWKPGLQIGRNNSPLPPSPPIRLLQLLGLSHRRFQLVTASVVRWPVVERWPGSCVRSWLANYGCRSAPEGAGGGGGVGGAARRQRTHQCAERTLGIPARAAPQSQGGRVE